MNGQLTKIIDHKARLKASAPQARYIFETVDFVRAPLLKFLNFKKTLFRETLIF